MCVPYFKKLLALLIISFIIGCNGPNPKNATTGETEYLEHKASFKTQLTKRTPAPQIFEPLTDDKDIKLVEYISDTLNLKGLLSTINIDSTKRKPVLVYLHGGFALGKGDLSDCEPFQKAGFIVFAPAYRGENGNPGYFELFLGEVDDAKAAINWVAKQRSQTAARSMFLVIALVVVFRQCSHCRKMFE